MKRLRATRFAAITGNLLRLVVHIGEDIVISGDVQPTRLRAGTRLDDETVIGLSAIAQPETRSSGFGEVQRYALPTAAT